MSVSYRSSDTSVLTVNNKGKISVKKDAAGKSRSEEVRIHPEGFYGIGNVKQFSMP